MEQKNREDRIRNALDGLEHTRDRVLPQLRACLVRCLETAGAELAGQESRHNLPDELSKALSHLAGLEAIVNDDGGLRAELKAAGPLAQVTENEPEDDILDGLENARTCLNVLIREAGPELNEIVVCDEKVSAGQFPEVGRVGNVKALEAVSRALGYIRFTEEMYRGFLGKDRTAQAKGAA